MTTIEWLPHLKDSIPREAKGYKVSSYAVALEGWRRGLQLKYIDRQRNPLKIRYSLSNGDKEYVFAGSRGELVTREAIRICMNKHKTKQYLKEAGVPTPEGEMFTEEVTNPEIIRYANHLGYPLVVKPVSGSGGNGVIANISSEAELVHALTYVRENLNYPRIIVEKFSPGVDYRVYVIGDQAIAAFDRIPANVVGNGVNTIEDLVRFKINERQKNPALYNRPITIDDEVYNLLEAKGYSLNTIPQEGERVFLKTKNNISSGGDSRDVTDNLTEEIKNIAVRATKAIPGLVQAGIDIIVDEKNNTGVVIEINSRPSIRNHLFPMEGKARDIPKAIIDFYFPETKGIKTNEQRPLFYFGLKDIHRAFRRGLAKEFVVPKMPTDNLVSLRIEITGDSNMLNHGEWVRNHAKKLGINGSIKYLRNNKTVLIVAGSTKSIEEFKKIIKSKIMKEHEITTFSESIYNKPIKIGFQVIGQGKRKRKKKMKSTKNSKIKKLKKERDFYKREYYKIKKSRSWRITKPMRILGGFLRNLKNKL